LVQLVKGRPTLLRGGGKDLYHMEERKANVALGRKLALPIYLLDEETTGGETFCQKGEKPSEEEGRSSRSRGEGNRRLIKRRSRSDRREESLPMRERTCPLVVSSRENDCVRSLSSAGKTDSGGKEGSPGQQGETSIVAP